MKKDFETLQDITSLLNELHEKWPNAIFVETKADFCEDEQDGVPGQNIRMTFKFNLDPGRASIIEFSHLFSIDASHIRILLEQKKASLQLGSKEGFEAFFEYNFLDIKNALRPYNGNRDDYETIVDLMIKSRGYIHGKSFGL